MICLNCGKAIDDDLKVCPFCGNLIESFDTDAASAYDSGLEDPLPTAETELPGDGQEYFDENPVYPEPRETGKKKLPIPASSGLPALLLSGLACLLSLICLLSVFSLRASVRDQSVVLAGSVSEVRNAVNAVNDRLGQLDTTISKVQSEAYNQLASQSIALTKDVTPLTGPVETGKRNRMFIISAKGNLQVYTSFDWQRYNTATGGWVSIVFTGNSSVNEEYGLRLENSYDAKENTYTSILWADGITPAASGTYRCVITDATGITKTSGEATVTVA